MSRTLQKIDKLASDNLGRLFSTPFIAAASQLNSVTASISTYFASRYAQDQAESLKSLIDLMSAKIRIIEDRYMDKEFLKPQMEEDLQFK